MGSVARLPPPSAAVDSSLGVGRLWVKWTGSEGVVDVDVDVDIEVDDPVVGSKLAADGLRFKFPSPPSLCSALGCFLLLLFFLAAGRATEAGAVPNEELPVIISPVGCEGLMGPPEFPFVELGWG